MEKIETTKLIDLACEKESTEFCWKLVKLINEIKKEG
ncbi:hypothetical protein Goe4_c00140 [Bacillus phage vB_BthP-Goe4]|uniref:Uncharacterized protein n=1 Tax=Bacillus phage vB_BthP-Goe4 TaxID=2315470 RepID=A0A386KSR0_9CAUD|nr:hypothetical protein H3015_gp30 [Bacillus phage vB_BthP-Goe4]AYD87723.1 hypothetical protein Goe4_c00140 [Bacillus phage vB_BthP-Goe4]